MSASHARNIQSASALGADPLFQAAMTAWHRLTEVVQIVFQRRPAAAPAGLSLFQEVESLRALADDVLAQDPNFAQDLYAQADQLERAAQA